MTTYLVQADPSASLPEPPSTSSGGPKERHKRLEQIAESRLSNRSVQDLMHWLEDNQIAMKGPKAELLITGTAVVDLTDDQFQRIRREVQGVQALADEPISVFQPRLVDPAPEQPSGKALWHLDAIGLTAARQAGFKGTGKGVRIGLLDTGVDDTHPELSTKIKEHLELDPVTGAASTMSPPRDTEGHGTRMAGLLCSNTIGVAPDAEIVSVVMLPRGRGMASNFLHGLYWSVTRRDIRIINISAGILNLASAMEGALRAALSVGILPVVATGDAGVNKTYSPGNLEASFSVGASSEKGRIPKFSSGATLPGNAGAGYTVPDLVAPGERVIATQPGGGGYAFFSGTSLSAPIVSGIAALVLEKSFSSIGVADLIQVLLSSCRDLNRPADRQGHGLIQVSPAAWP